ncbi:MAG: cellulase family glycosylhydrolase [Bacteroidales bacterium]|jgi:hypothetical protein|nr:cellulase family glycosylhydrolase [Bacteroidales bacterium]
MKKRIILCALIATICSTHSFAQTHAFEMNSRLGMGINLGNVFEAPTLGGWGVDVDTSYFKEIKEKGFSSLRIPVRWSAHADEEAPYAIHQYFMDTIQWAVDLALANGLVAVINIHHYEDMMEEPEAHKARFLALWEQIANEFQHYSDSVYFELFNEPNTNFTSTLWNEYLAEALAVVRKTNPTRMVIIGTAEWGGVSGLQQLVLPNDENIILTLHYYEPFKFTHQGADWTGQTLPTGVTWNATTAQKNAIRTDMSIIKTYSDTHNVPVYIGEFGAIEYADDDSRARWIDFLRSVYEEYGFSASYWEFCSGFGIYNPVLNCYRTGMLQALTGFEEACDCTQFDTVIVSNSTFDKSTRPWILNVYETNGSSASIAAIDGKARIEIGAIGEESWHLQLLYSSFPVKQGYTYTFTFDAYASDPTTIGAMINRDGGDYASAVFINTNLTTEEQMFSQTFTYTEPTMPKARIAFDFGLTNAHYLYFDNIHVYETSPETSLVNAEKLSHCTLTIDNHSFSIEGNTIEMLTIYDLYGRMHYQKNYSNATTIEIENSMLPSGVSVLQVQTDRGITTIKRLK